MAISSSIHKPIIFSVSLVVLLVTVRVKSSQVQYSTFMPAYSYLVSRKQKMPVCFDDRMSIALKIKARSSSDCIIKCLVKTCNQMRGMNYMSSNDCPEGFDYVIESDKCYQLRYERQTWAKGRSLCNSIYNSHPATIENDVENDVCYEYVNSTASSYTFCPGSNFPTWFAFYIGGLRTYIKGVRTPFLWSPYPGIFKPIQNTSAWHSGEPNSLADGTEYCVQNILFGYIGWDDQECFLPLCVLCEYDITV
ncbi:hypothetical protein HELRODRAFT_195104 [Helobdella robusta]|uniref:C-type lectin domain-containing protein n=1 Tax=Helobdella robusta TaxID=6412 RepID=T1FWR3_HELRO|nr:hypothetical protein HELRODRAFT_195104 [Helobdella robusta]ESO05144.1 hypothetical protein HELRODRAFT_195104 [Helobdella robusta]